MALQKSKWADLRVGILITAGLVIFLAVVFKIGTQEKLFSSKYKLWFFVPNVQNLNKGAYVSLSGIKVGLVSELELAQLHDQYGVKVWMKIDKAYSDRITKSSRAEILTLGLLGDKYVDVTQGQVAEKPLQNGDELSVTTATDFNTIAQRALNTIDSMDSLLSSSKSITDKINKGQGTLGMLVDDPQFRNEISQMIVSTQHLLAALNSSQGTFGLFLKDSTVYRNIASATGDLSNLAKKVEEGQGSLGRLILDPALYDNLESLSARTDSLVAKISTKGTTGELLASSQVYTEVQQLLQDMQSLINDIKKNPHKYINVKIF